MNVSVVFTSGGTNWLGTDLAEGAMLKQKIHQIRISAKGFPDPVNDPKAGEFKHMPGTDPRAQEFLRGQKGAQQWLYDRLAEITDRLEGLQGAGEPSILHVAVRCRGGFQRSVGIVELLASMLQAEKPDIKVVKSHLTLPLVMSVRQQHFGVNLDDTLTLDDVVQVF